MVRLSGESDVSTVGPLKDALNAQISGGARHLTVDLSELGFADSASINVLLAAHRTLRELGGGLEPAFPQPPVAQMLTLLGVDQVLTVRTQARAGTAEEGLGASLPGRLLAPHGGSCLYEGPMPAAADGSATWRLARHSTRRSAPIR